MSTRTMEEYYARRAAEYEAIYLKPERQSDLAVLKERVKGLLEGHRTLEVACGTGYWTEVLAPVCRSIVATDFLKMHFACDMAGRFANRDEDPNQLAVTGRPGSC